MSRIVEIIYNVDYYTLTYFLSRSIYLYYIQNVKSIYIIIYDM